MRGKINVPYANHALITNLLQSLQGRQDNQEAAARVVSAVPGLSSMYDVEQLTSEGTVPNVNDLSHEEQTEVYNSYSFAHKPQNSLQIMAHRQKVSKMYLTI
jgi:hypothetical protein